MKISKLLCASLLAVSLTACSSTTEEPKDDTSKATETNSAVEPTESKTADSDKPAVSTKDEAPELTGDTEQDYQNAVAFYSKAFEESGKEATENFKKEASGFEGTSTELFDLYADATSHLSDLLTASAMKLEAIFMKDPNQDEALKDKYSSELETAYKAASQDSYAEYMSKTADLTANQ